MTTTTARAAAWRIALLALAVVLVALIWITSLTLASRAQLAGRASIDGLSAPVRIERDAIGVPRIAAETYHDALTALGFLHAQERFFQMDLARRYAAGRLGELLGPAALGSDRFTRTFDLQRIADRVVDEMPGHQRAWLEVYATGVNEGLRRLAARPPEHLALRVTPEPWQPRDSVLVGLFMHLGLSMVDDTDESTKILRDAMPAELAAFLRPRLTRWDVLLHGAEHAYQPAAVPGAGAVDLRLAPPSDDGSSDDTPLVPGSNSWVASGSRTATGDAIMANDMHLGTRVPNTWYRAHIDTPEVMAVGVSLPGVPGIIAGSNGRVAWGFTNVTGDFLDWIIVEPDPEDDTRYLTADGPEAFGSVTHEFRAGGQTQARTLRTTRWGPVIEGGVAGQDAVCLWTGSDPARHNLGMLDLVTAATLEQALGIASTWMGPPQNVVVADDRGRVGWTIGGSIPIRRGFDGTAAVPSSTIGVAWDGQLDPARKPRVVEPASGFLVTANSRTTGGELGDSIGRNWALGVRARRILDRLESAGPLDEAAMLDIQNDANAAWLAFYRRLVTDTADSSDDPRHQRVAEALREWDGTAGVDQIGYPLVKRFRSELADALIDALVAAHEDVERWHIAQWLNAEEWLRRVLEERPANWLPHPHASWDALLAHALGETVDAYGDRGVPRPWGESNRTRIRHPFTQTLGPGPFGVLHRLLDMPRQPHAGDGRLVRVATRSFGASQRLVVSPGHEDRGILHMPAGQSGHFLSPHYRAGHADWVAGRATPLLPGDPAHTLRLVPR